MNSIIPDDVTTIGNYAFYQCTGLTSVTIPDGVTNLEYQFYKCSGLETITVASGNTKYYSQDNCIIEKDSHKLVLGCKNSIIPDGVTSIGDFAFNGCTGLTSITIPDGVTSIGKAAFSDCTSLTSVTIPASVTSISWEAFIYCTGLTSVTIPASVTNIDNDAFMDCSSLASVTIYAPKLDNYGYDAFNYNASGRKIYVFSDCVETYRAKASELGVDAADIVAIEGIALADAADNSALITAGDDATLNVTLTGRTLYKDGDWNTLCLPFAVVDGDATDQVSFSGTPLEGATVMTLGNSQGCNTGYDASTGTLTLDFVEADEIEPGVAYIVKWTTGDNIVNPTFSGVTIENENPADKATVSQDGYVSFVGSYCPVDIYTTEKTNLYLGGSNTLYYPWGDGMTKFIINACRAYFQLKKGLTAGDKTNGVRAFVLNFGDEESQGITTTDFRDYTDSDGAWYDLNGRKFDGVPTAKGIYLHGGRKVVIK
jgi:hypothetical protein